MGDVINLEDRFPVPSLVIDLSAAPEHVANQIVGLFPAPRNDEIERTIIARYIGELQATSKNLAQDHSKACLEGERLKTAFRKEAAGGQVTLSIDAMDFLIDRLLGRTKAERVLMARIDDFQDGREQGWRDKEKTGAELQRTMTEAVRISRCMALDAAIATCRLFAESGECSEGCIKALEDLKTMLPQPPSKGN